MNVFFDGEYQKFEQHFLILNMTCSNKIYDKKKLQTIHKSDNME